MVAPRSSRLLAFVRVVNTRDLSALVGESQESRVAADIVFHVGVIAHAAVDQIAAIGGPNFTTTAGEGVTVTFGT